MNKILFFIIILFIFSSCKVREKSVVPALQEETITQEDRIKSLNRKLISEILYTGDTEIIQTLIKDGAEINTLINGNTPLGVAAGKDRIDVVNILLENGSNINKVDDNEFTPLFIAISKNNYEMCKFLIEKGANIEFADTNGNTALMNASTMGNLKIVKLIIEKGANMSKKNNYGYTALTFAENNGNTELISYLKSLIKQ
ncbi:MAG: hypothetical protein A2W98_07475 [Bacteroidetes bacterium GWF2_33_38]|nr:MAG: hypothetical protein A2W98_07475 [Bacteroidetes bacterium GWF2_33_38]OFY69061.1 MAG: hypothetical protein A2265_05980 [Bacteroidetes bacterium RIFOXYA12_FULL_33_9]OFY89786.1 MAG: hypothetical protein A2236_05340 [Bacteroidetes bacterium RIFOXYA2_FULL_33_7]